MIKNTCVKKGNYLRIMLAVLPRSSAGEGYDWGMSRKKIFRVINGKAG